MHQLRSSNLDNAKYIDALENNIDLLNDICSTWKANTLKFFIYNEQLDEKSYKIYATALSCSDKLSEPLTFQEANFLWFVLCVNFANLNKELELNIKSPVYARTLYELCNGEYEELKLENDHSEKKHKEAYCRFLARHTALFPEKNIYWEIPVSFYKNHCMVSGDWAKFAYANIGDIKYKIPRSIFMQFFKDSIAQGKVIGNNSNDIRLFFNENDNEPLFETLKYMGYEAFSKIKKDENIEYYYDTTTDEGLIAHLLNRNAKLYENEEDAIYWHEVMPNSYHYLNRGEEYLPIKYGEYIYIYKN